MAPRKVGILLAMAAGVVALALATRPWSVLGGDDGLRPPTADAPGDRDGAPSTTAAARPGILAGARASRPEDGGPLPAPVAFDAVDRERDLHGVVVDADGRAIAGATLTAVSYPAAGVDVAGLDRDEPGRPGPSTRSASDGTFALRLRPGVEVGLRVTAAGFAPVEVSNCLAGARVRVTLHAGVALRVTVKDPEGRPVEGVAVRVFERHPSPVRIDARATTDADGVARLGDLPPSTVVWVEASHPTRESAPWASVRLPPSGEVLREFASQPGRTIRGRAVDAETGAGVGGARVGETEWMHRSVTTEADGSFVFAGWEVRGETELWVLAEGYARAVRDVPPTGDVDFALTRGDSIVGRVTDAEGRPLRDAEVFAIARAVPNVPARGRGRGRARTGGDGRFRLEDLRRDAPQALVVMADGFGRTLLDVQPHAERPGRIDVGDIVLPVARRIAGRVRTADGLPIPGAVVTLVGGHTDRSRLRGGAESSDDEVADDAGASAEAHTDDVGRFGFADVAPGRYVARVELPGMPTVARELTVPSTGDVLDVELVVEAGRAFRVTVEDDAGEPVPWAWVHILTADGQGRGVRLDERGSVTVTLPESDLRILVTTYAAIRGDERRFILDRVERDVEPGSREATIVLVRAQPIAGRVVGPDGEPLPRVAVEAVHADIRASGRRVVVTDERGAFEFVVPVGHPVELRVLAPAAVGSTDPRHPNVTGRQRAVAPGTRDVVLRAKPLTFTGTQEVLVLDVEGRALRGARVTSSFRGPGAVPPSITDTTGRATITGLADAPQSWSVEPPADRAELLHGRTDATYPGDGPVIVRLARGRLVTGRVVSPRGGTVEHLRVRFTPHLDDDDPPIEHGDWLAVDVGTGRFVTVLDPEEWATLTAHAVAVAGPSGDGVTHRSPRVEVGPEGSELVLVLEPLPPR